MQPEQKIGGSDNKRYDVNNKNGKCTVKYKKKILLTSRFIFFFARLCIKPLQANDKQTKFSDAGILFQRFQKMLQHFYNEENLVIQCNASVVFSCLLKRKSKADFNYKKKYISLHVKKKKHGTQLIAFSFQRWERKKCCTHTKWW